MTERLAVLFWFYKDAPTCRNHLLLFRKSNPQTIVFGLYGGDKAAANDFREALDDLLDDFYICPEDDPAVKWRHGDLMIADWFRQRGQDLNWDSLFILQWDALVFTNLDELFQARRQEELFFSGLRSLDQQNLNRWHWTSDENKEERANYDAFRQIIANTYPDSTDDDWISCIFVFEILTRDFLNQYISIKRPRIGFLEYKMPTYAKIWGYNFYELGLGLLNPNDGRLIDKRPANGIGLEIKTDFISAELRKDDGWRLFHPYFNEWPLFD